MKYCPPFFPFALIGTHRSVCIVSNGFFVEYSCDLNYVLLCFPCRQYSHIVLADFEISDIYLIASFMLILTRLSNSMCPILLFQSQLSFSFPKKHISFPIPFNMYMLFGVLTGVATNFIDHIFLISHFSESNISLCS
jgi:hypothetical protein